LAISADGSLIAVTSRRLATEVILLTASGTPHGTITATGRVSGLALSPDGRLIAIRTIEGFDVWDTRAYTLLLRVTESPSAFAFVPTKPPTLALTESLAPITVVDPIERKMLADIKPHADVELMAGTPDNRLVLALSDGSLELWDVASQTRIRTFDVGDPHDRAHALAVDGAGKTLAVGTRRSRIALFDLAD
jgi:WD40 repeat protein